MTSLSASVVPVKSTLAELLAYYSVGGEHESQLNALAAELADWTAEADNALAARADELAEDAYAMECYENGLSFA